MTWTEYKKDFNETMGRDPLPIEVFMDLMEIIKEKEKENKNEN
jgi:hypothetical protein